MPKWGEMTQVSRPFQIALVAVVLFAGVWFFALGGHHASTSSSSSSTPAPATAPDGAEQEKANATPTTVVHGTAPGVPGLTRAINRAHGAVAASQQSGKHIEEKAAQASGSSSAPASPSSSAAPPAATTTTAPSSAHHSSAPAAASGTAAVTKTAAPSSTKEGSSTAQSGSSSGSAVSHLPPGQAKVEKAVKEGKVAVVLFWNPHGSDDVAVQQSLQLLLEVHRVLKPLTSKPALQKLEKAEGTELEVPMAVFEASAKEVASFGSVTRTVQVLQTPTLMFVNQKGQVSVLTGLADSYSIQKQLEQAHKG
jgi:hypothetical protein